MLHLPNVIRDAANEIGVTYRSYSGRGMYGGQCSAVVGSQQDCLRLIGEVIKVYAAAVTAAALRQEHNELADAEAVFEEVVDNMLAYRIDQLGFDIVMYWEEIEPTVD